MPVSEAELRRIAALAHLRLPEGEPARRQLAAQLEKILDHIHALGTWNAPARAEPSALPEAAPSFRDPALPPDPLEEGAPADRAPDWRDGFFAVPRLAAMDPGRKGSRAEPPAPAPAPPGVPRPAEPPAGRAVSDPFNIFISRARDEPGVGPPPHALREGPLQGVPVAVKDNLCTLGLPTTCGSRFLEGYHSPFEATAVRRLREAGAFVLGKTNMDEFSMGSSTEHSAFGPTRNPLDPERVPGGSSGGSAAAVAAGLAPCALGSDTGGSVRQPAAFCGVVGIKPTWGRVSRYGLVAFASSLDQVGTFGRGVREAALLLEAIAGHDPRDATSARRPVPSLVRALDEGVAGRVIGFPREYLPDTLDSGVRRCVEEAAERLRGAGALLREVSLPHTEAAVPVYYVLAPAEASSNLARFDGVRYGVRAAGARSTRELVGASRTRGFGPEVERRILLGTYALSAERQAEYYARAQGVRALVAGDFRRVWDEGVDLLLTPTAPTPAFALGERTGDPVAMYLSDVFTVGANLAGIPALSLPIGHVDGLPVGGQLMAPPWEEARLVAAARALEATFEGGVEGEGVT